MPGNEAGVWSISRGDDAAGIPWRIFDPEKRDRFRGTFEAAMAHFALALRREDELCAALAPFARAEILPGAPDDGLACGWVDDPTMPTVAAFRRARAVLNPPMQKMEIPQT